MNTSIKTIKNNSNFNQSKRTCVCWTAGSSDGGVRIFRETVWAAKSNNGIVRKARVSCQPREGIKSCQPLVIQSVLLAPYTGPCKSGNQRNGSYGKQNNNKNCYYKCSIIYCNSYDEHI